ncbi:uncharacterized protein LOC113561950 [Ooceraea biroi]|uniref:uncharacterized protein LOC113561950 n=1 Tax=Ooceraea biroi TaxID=2015173 RepID=UPI000F0793D8|nr:uncharacterized protein LOC113561950 [Ooceraea biroi]
MRGWGDRERSYNEVRQLQVNFWSTDGKQTTEKTNVKKRQTKATQAQIDYMVDYFIQHLHVATGKFNTLQGNSDLRASWEQLVSDLNKMSKDGKTKDMKSWKSTWRDNKTAVSQKVAKIRENRVTTGNRSGPPLKLTEREEKILGIMGFDYVEGVQCPDSFPEEQLSKYSASKELLSQGQNEVLENIPEMITVRDSNGVISTNFTDCEIIHEFQVAENGELLHAQMPNSQTASTAKEQTMVESEIMQSPETNPRRNISEQLKRIQPARVTKRGRKRLAIQLTDAREDFSALTERQITCMEMFAQILKQISDNKERNEILRAFIETERTRDKTYAELSAIIKDCIDVLSKKILNI